jgi:predicted nucleotide-binding protein
MKPKIFIGSSVEGLSIAYAVQNNLQYDGDVTVWNQGVFELSKTAIESLNDLIENTDFGIFVFSPDDMIKIKDRMQNTVRDNVIFELGLFIGKLSRKRTFIIIPDKTELRIPTDLIGITPGKFEINREDGNLEAATAPVCHQIRN